VAVHVRIRSGADGDDRDGDGEGEGYGDAHGHGDGDGDGDCVGDSDHSTRSTYTSRLAMSTSASKLSQTYTFLLARASTNSEIPIGQKFPVENSTPPAWSIQRLVELQTPGTGSREAGGVWHRPADGG
jgi:hypothetical protein